MEIQLIILGVLILLSGFFSSAETALVSVTKAQAKSLLKQNKSGAKALDYFKQQPYRLIITILIGNNIVNIFAASLATVTFTEIYGHRGVGMATGVMTFLILVFGEIVPKSLAAKYTTKVALIYARPVYCIMLVLYPLVVIFTRFTKWLLKKVSSKGESVDPSVTEDEVMAMVSIGAEEGILEKYEQKFIENVFEFSDTVVEEIMTARNKIEALDSDIRVSQAAKKILKSPYSRFPVYKNDIDLVVGVVHIKQVLDLFIKGDDKIKLKNIELHNTIEVPHTMKIHDLFLLFQKEQKHLAMVFNAHGTLLGIVTLEDVLEEIVGDIKDETDLSEKTFTVINKSTIIASGEAEINDVNEAFKIKLKIDEHNTIATYILEELHRFPKLNESFKLEGLKFTILKMEGNILKKVKLEKS